MYSRSRFSIVSLLGVWALLFTAQAFAAEEVSVTDVPVPVSDFQFSFSQSVKASQGSFDPYGYYIPFPEGSSAITLMTSFGGSYRLSKLFDVGFGISFRDSQMKFPTGTSSSWSLSSPHVDARYHHGGWSHLILHLGTSLPWSRRVKHEEGYPGAAMADDMGDAMGASYGMAIRAGAGVSHSFHPIRVALDASSTIPFASDAPPKEDPSGPPVKQRKAIGIRTSEGISYELGPRWGANASLKQAWAGDTVTNGMDLSGTASRAFSTGVGLSYSVKRDWRWAAGYETPFPFYAYAVNQSYGPTVSVSMMHTGF